MVLEVSRRLRNEDGITVIAGVAISFVVLLLVLAMLSLATHSNEATVGDRARAQGIQAAEAVVSQMVDGLGRQVCVADVGFPDPTPLVVDGKTVARYQAVVRVPAEAGVTNPAALTWNPNDSTGSSCTTPVTGTQDRVITAWGYGQTDAAEPRAIEVKVSVTPDDHFRYACYAGRVSGSGGTLIAPASGLAVAGDCYANAFSGVVREANNVTSATSLTLPAGSRVSGDVRAADAVTVGATSTVGRVFSASSSVSMGSGVSITGGMVVAGTTISGLPAGYNGVRCPPTDSAPGCPTTRPAAPELPPLACVVSNVVCWSAMYPGMTPIGGGALTALLTANRQSLSGSFLVTDNMPVVLDFRQGGDARLTGPLTIVSSGRVDLGGAFRRGPGACSGSPSSCFVTVVSANIVPASIQLLPNLEVENGVTALLYGIGPIRSVGDGMVDVNGAIYASSIDASSAYPVRLTFAQDLVTNSPPIVTWTKRYQVLVQAWRELPL